MFSTGQLIFAGLFIIAFTIAIVMMYKKDRELHAKNYKGIKWVFIYFGVFVVFLFLIKYLLKN